MDPYTDKTRLEIVIKNLLTNSFRYADFSKPNPFIKIDIVIDAVNTSISISDNGIGIAQQHLSKVFDMFYSAVDHSKGTGIGLFLVKESVKMLRGHITVKSKFSEWTIFHLNIPNLNQGTVSLPETEAVVFEEIAQENFKN